MEVVKVVRRLIDLIEGNTIPTEEITSEFKFVILILRNLSAFDIISHRNHKIFVGFIRHAVIRLLSCHPVGAAHLVHVGLDLFGALIESDIGLGSGLWIHVLIYPLISQIIQSLKSTKLVLGASERAPYLIKILSVVNLLLKKIPSALAINYASAVISLALLDISPNDSELSTILITTGWMVWSCKALESSFSNVHYDWESIVFRRCVDKILVSDVNPSLYALDQALASCNSASHLIGSDFLTMSDEVEAWRYLSQSRHPIETRLILYRVLAAWSTLEVRLNLDSDESLDEELASNILLERVLNPYLRLFESNLLLWADHLKLVSLDSLSWCICGHVGRLFCPSLETGEHIDFFGIMLQWLLLLHKIESYCISAPWSHRSLIGTAISKSKFFHCLMKISVGLLMTIQIREFPSSKELSQLFCHGDLLEKDPSDKYRICFLFYVFSRTIMTLPTASRAFYLGECSRSEANIIEKFVESYINERVIQREVSIIEAIQSETLDIRCCPSTGEIITTYVADEVSIEMSIKLPKLYPLRNVEVECQRRMGINEGRWRKWTLQVRLIFPSLVKTFRLSNCSLSVMDLFTTQYYFGKRMSTKNLKELSRVQYVTQC